CASSQWRTHRRESLWRAIARGFLLFSRYGMTNVDRTNTDFAAPTNDRSGGVPLLVTVQGEMAYFSDTILKARAVQALDWGARRFPIHREVRFAARRRLEEL